MSKRGHPEEQIPRALHRRLQGVPRGQMRIISMRSVVIPSEKWRDKSTVSSWVLSPTGFRIPPSPPRLSPGTSGYIDGRMGANCERQAAA